MATYAIPPQKGIADVLNEAADANERGMEGARRSALTMSQLQGEQQRQRFAEAEAGRQDKRFGFEVENQEYQRRQREREQKMVDDISAAAQGYLFREVSEPNPNATAGSIPGREVASVDAQTGRTTMPPPATVTRRVPLDLSTPEGLRGIADFQVAVFQARAKAGKVDQNELNSLVTFGNLLEQRGNRDLFRQALSGDERATTSLAAKLGLDPNNLRIEGGVDNDKNSKTYGFPNIFAVRSTPDGKGGTTITRTPIGHLAALYSPEIYEATVTKPTALTQAVADVRYKDAAGAAATSNAQSTAQDAATRARVGDSTVKLNDARASALKDGTDPVNTAAHKTSLYSSFTDADGKNIVLPSAATNKARIAGQAEALGIPRRQAQRFADEEWARITANRSDIISRMRAKKEAEGGKPLANTVRINVGLEDEGLTSFTSAYLNSQGDEGLAARARLYMSRRQAAMKDPKDED